MAPSQKPIFVATHPRACSTAFERVFMTRTDLTCIHEPFGDAFYFGPERLSGRYEDDEGERERSGFKGTTFADVLEGIEGEGGKTGKRLFIKDIAHYLSPPFEKEASIAPSLGGIPKRGVGTTNGTNGHATNGHTNGFATSNGNTNGNSLNGHTNGTTNGHSKPPFPYGTEAEPGNPTVVPAAILKKFHFTFLIRHPRSSIPSYYRCTIPPLSEITGFSEFYPSEAGYSELRRIFDYLRSVGQIGPRIAGEAGVDEAANGEGEKEGEVSITVIDADDLLDNPNGVIEGYCREVGLEYSDSMLRWDGEEEVERAKRQFEKWRGFHEDAIESKSLRPRDPAKKKPKSKEVENQEWAEKFGEEAAKVIRETVDANVKDYEYLKSFAMKVPFKEPEQL